MHTHESNRVHTEGIIDDMVIRGEAIDRNLAELFDSETYLSLDHDHEAIAAAAQAVEAAQKAVSYLRRIADETAAGPTAG